MIETEAVISTAAQQSARTLDYELAQKAAAGDMEAFEQIYWRHHRRVFGICIKMLMNEAAAEDVTQQVFITLFKRVGTFRGDAAFTTWLHRMTVNQVLMHLRYKRSRRENTTDDGELPESTPVFTREPNAASAADRIMLQDAIKKLPKGYRTIFVLHDIKGFQHDEIASILGCSSGTSKSQLFKARLKLRTLLQPV